MQEDVEMKTVMLVINGSKLTGRTLKSAIQKLLAHMRDHSRRDVTPHGKQTVKQLLQKDQGASTIEINDPSIKDFERIARKYGVDYAIKKCKGDKPKYRKNTEYGSARWGTAQDIQPYIDPVFENNIILTQTERLMMSGRSKNPANARNKNVLIVGGSGSGKTRFWIKPNLMQCTSEKYPCSFVVTDPKGSIVVECGKLLQRKGYRIKILNTINFSRSMHYSRKPSSFPTATVRTASPPSGTHWPGCWATTAA